MADDEPMTPGAPGEGGRRRDIVAPHSLTKAPLIPNDSLVARTRVWTVYLTLVGLAVGHLPAQRKSPPRRLVEVGRFRIHRGATSCLARAEVNEKCV